MRNLRPQHGMILTEMLFVISILGVVMVLQAQLFNASMRTIGGLPTAQAEAAKVSQMTQMLRRDVWNATRIDQPEAGRITLGRDDGNSISWEFKSEGQITRSTTQPSEHLQWTIKPSPILVRSSTGVILQTSTDRRPLLNQAMILTEQTR